MALLLLATWLEVSELRYRANVLPATAAMILYGGVALSFLLLIRWWWRDWQREKAAREALVEKLRQEGRGLVVPPMSAGKKAWRWTVNGYALFLVAAGVYVLIRYLVRH